MNGLRPHNSLDQAVYALAQRPNGVATAEVEGYTVKLVDYAVRRLMANGTIFRAKMGHRTVRYFATAEAAEAYQTARRVPESNNYRRTTGNPSRQRAAWPEGTPAVYPKNPDGSPAYKVTIAPPPPRCLRSNTWSQLP